MAGKDSKLSIAGVVSVVVSKAKSTVNLAGNAEKTRLYGGDITVESTDKSRLTARAGGLSVSKGASIGMGIASTTIVSQNDVRAEIGQNHDIQGGSLKLNAEKQAVTAEDFKNLIDMRYLITDSSKLDDEEREEAELGLIDLHKGEDDDSYSMDINLSSDKLLKAMDGLNFLSGQNTYAEAIAGSVAFGGDNAKLSLAGSFAVARARNNVLASMGEGTTVNLTADGGKSGSMNVNSAIGTTSRIIAGSLSAAPAKTSVGATVAVLVDTDEARTVTGANTTVDAEGDVRQSAKANGEAQVFTAAMAVAANATKKTNAAGGAVKVIVNESVAENSVGDNIAVKAGGSATVDADTLFDLMVISGSANVAASSTASVAAGGTVNVIVDKAASRVSMGQNVNLDAQKGVKVTSDVSDQLISGAASLSAGASIGGKAGAGAVNVIVSKSAAETGVGDGSALTAQAGDVKVTANNDAWMLNATLAAAGGGNKAIGGSFNVNVFDRKATVDVGKNARLTAGGDLLTQAGGRDSNILAGLAVAGAGTGMTLSSNAEVLVQNNAIKTTLGEYTVATAQKNAVLESYYKDFTVAAGGSVAVSGMGSAVGATVATVVKNNDIGTYLNNASVTAKGSRAVVETLSHEKINGAYVGANAEETQFVGGAGVAVAGSNAINGVVAVLVNNNKVISDASRAALSSSIVTGQVKKTYPLYFRNKNYNPDEYVEAESVDDAIRLLSFPDISIYIKLPSGEYKRVTSEEEFYYTEDVVDGGDVSVVASDDTKQLLLAGGLSASLGSGAGAAVVTLVSNKNVEAKAHDISANRKVTVSADNRDDIKQLSISAGLSGGSGVQVGAAVQVLKSKAIANVDGAVKSASDDFDLKANNDTSLYNIGAALLAAAGGAAVTPVGVVTYFQGETEAKLASGASVEANNINIETTANKNINMYAAGMAISSGMGVSGTVSVLVSKDTNKASAMEGATLTARNDLKVDAKVNTAALSVSALSAGANVATADLSMRQAASLVVGERLDVDGGVDVQSVIKKDSAGTDLARATATVASGSNSFSFSLGEFNLSRAVARENLQNTAAIRGGASGVQRIMGKVDKGRYVTETFFDYDYDQVDSVTYRLKVPSDHPTITASGNENEVKREFLMRYYFTPANRDSFGNKEKNFEKVVKTLENSQKPLQSLRSVLQRTSAERIIRYSDAQARLFFTRYANEEILNAMKELEGTENLQQLLIKARNYTDDNTWTVALQTAVNEADKYGLFDWEETYNYKKTEQTRTVWHENWEDMEIEVPVYKVGYNRLNADSVDLHASGDTRAEARTDGALSFTGITAGSLEADSFSTDTVSAIVEGLFITTKKDIDIRSEGNTTVDSVGYKPGGISAVDAGNTDVKAGVGTKNARKSVTVVVGDEVRMTAHGNFNVEADNRGSVTASMKQGTSGSLGKIKTSSQATESYYNTLISFGKENYITADGDITIRSNDAPKAESKVASNNIGILMNFNTMMGKNLVRQENNIDFGSNANITSRHGDVFVEARQSTLAEAETVNNGGSLLEGSNAQAYNLVDRQVRVNMRNSYIMDQDKNTTIRAISGEGDRIRTRAYTGSAGLASVAKADVRSDAEVIIGSGAHIDSKTGTTLEATATSYQKKGRSSNDVGIETMRDIGSIFYIPNSNAVTDVKLRSELLNALSEAVVYVVRGIGRSQSRGLSFCYAVGFDEKELDVYSRSCPCPHYMAFLDALSDWTAPDWVYVLADRQPELNTLDDYQVTIEKRRRDNGMPACYVSWDEDALISDVDYCLYRRDEATGQIISLGRNVCGQIIQKDGALWSAIDPGHWAAVEGVTCSIDVVAATESYCLYNIPVRIGSVNWNLRCGRRYTRYLSEKYIEQETASEYIIHSTLDLIKKIQDDHVGQTCPFDQQLFFAICDLQTLQPKAEYKAALENAVRLVREAGVPLSDALKLD